MLSRALASSILIAGLSAGCSGPQPVSSSGNISINVGGLSIPGLVNACYSLAITTPTDTVVERSGICADDYGDGESAITFIAPCDASSSTNRVSLILESLTDEVGPVDADTYINPCGDPTVATNSPLYNYDGHGPCSLDVTCSANTDSPAFFDLTVMRSAGQGFFDIMVSFEDIFCSAKADCTDPTTGLPRELLFAPDGTTRIPTAVFAMSCTSGDLPADTHLYFTNLTITCEGQAPIVLPMHGAPGNQFSTTSPAPAPLTQASIYRGAEALINQATGQPAGKVFQTVALGFELDGDPRSCTASLTATATSGPLDECRLETGVIYPTITWQIDLTNAAGTGFACTQHALDATPLDNVFTSYPSTSPAFASTVNTVASVAVATACDEAPALGSIEGVVYYERWRSFMNFLEAGRPLFFDGQNEFCVDLQGGPDVNCWQFFGYDAPSGSDTWDRLWFVQHGPEGFDLTSHDPVIQIVGSGGYSAAVTLTGTDGDYRFDGLPTDQQYCVRWVNAGFVPFNFPRWPSEPAIALYATNTTIDGDVADWPDVPLEGCGLSVTEGGTTRQDFGMVYNDAGFNIVPPPDGEIELNFYWEGFYAGQPTTPDWPEAWLDWHTPGYQWDDSGSTGNAVGFCDTGVPTTSTCDTFMTDFMPWSAESGVELFDVDLFEEAGGTLGDFIANTLVTVSPSSTYAFFDVPAGTYCLRWNNPPGPLTVGGVDNEGGGTFWASTALQATLWPSEPYQQYTGAPGPDPMWDGSPLIHCGISVESGETTLTGFGFVFHD